MFKSILGKVDMTNWCSMVSWRFCGGFRVGGWPLPVACRSLPLMRAAHHIALLNLVGILSPVAVSCQSAAVFPPACTQLRCGPPPAIVVCGNELGHASPADGYIPMMYVCCVETLLQGQRATPGKTAEFERHRLDHRDPPHAKMGGSSAPQ